jgi:hypothetical protein
MSRSRADAPGYEEAHRHADTLFPRASWDQAQRDLERLGEYLAGLAASVGAELRGNAAGKHPYPSRGVAKMVGGSDIEVRLFLDYANAELVEPTYTLAVFRTSRQPRTDWQTAGRFAASQVRTLAPEVGHALKATIAREFAYSGSR